MEDLKPCPFCGGGGAACYCELPGWRPLPGTLHGLRRFDVAEDYRVKKRHKELEQEDSK